MTENEKIETQQTTVDNKAEKITKNNKIIPICLIIALVLCITLAGFCFYNNTPKQIFVKTINKLYAKYDTIVNRDISFDITKNSIKYKGDLNLDTNIEGFEKLKEDTFYINGGIDYKNKKAEGGILLKEGNTKLVDVMAYIVENRLYMTLGDDYKGLIDAGEYNSKDLFKFENDKNDNFDKSDVNYVVKKYKDIIIDSIDEKDLVKEKTTIKLNGKDTKVNKISYEINKDNYEKVNKNIIDKTLEDKELIKKLAKLSNKKENEIIDSLKEDKNNIKPITNEKMSIEIYTNGFLNKNFVGINIKLDDKYKFNYLINKNNSQIEFTADNKMAINLTVKENTDEKVNVDYQVKYGKTNVSGNLTITIKETSKNKYKGSINFTLEYDKYSVSMKMNYSVELGSKLTDIDTKKAVDADKASNDLNIAINNILNRLSKSNIGNIINGLTGYSNNYYYDYD